MFKVRCNVLKWQKYLSTLCKYLIHKVIKQRKWTEITSLVSSSLISLNPKQIKYYQKIDSWAFLGLLSKDSTKRTCSWINREIRSIHRPFNKFLPSGKYCTYQLYPWQHPSYITLNRYHLWLTIPAKRPNTMQKLFCSFWPPCTRTFWRLNRKEQFPPT